MNQNDRQFITDALSKALKDEVPSIVRSELSLALKEEVPKIVKAEMKSVLQNEVPAMIKTALDASNKEMKQFIVEHVSNEINDLAMVTANGFARLEARLDQAEKKIDYIGENYVKDETHYEVERRVKKLEFAGV